MNKFFNKIIGIIRASWWSGPSWMLTLCFIQVLVCVFYVLIHLKEKGSEYVQLEGDQVKTVNDLVSMYPDSQLPTSSLKQNTEKLKNDTTTAQYRLFDSVSKLRIQRNKMVKQFLQSVFKLENSEKQMADLDTTLIELNTKDAETYIAGKKFLAPSFFWLEGSRVYWEAILWSFIGVIVSLIYYVSLANQLTLQKAEDGDIGPFDNSEISGQVAKMFYAPTITLIVVLGYSYFSNNNKGMINISVNHGLIIFSFMAGFYSGRLMKLLDSVKNLILPTASNDNSKKDGDSATGNTVDIQVKLDLAQGVANGPNGPGITEAGFNTATVTLIPSGNPTGGIALKKPDDDQSGVFTGSKIPYGKYTIEAKYAYKNNQTILNLAASQPIEVSGGSKVFTVVLDLAKEQG
jgi:hypothetical protein